MHNDEVAIAARESDGEGGMKKGEVARDEKHKLKQAKKNAKEKRRRKTQGDAS